MALHFHQHRTDRHHIVVDRRLFRMISGEQVLVLALMVPVIAVAIALGPREEVHRILHDMVHQQVTQLAINLHLHIPAEPVVRMITGEYRLLG